jgi:hypothetical protein
VNISPNEGIFQTSKKTRPAKTADHRGVRRSMIQSITSQAPQSKQPPRPTPDVSLRVAATRTSTTAGRRDHPRADAYSSTPSLPSARIDLSAPAGAGAPATRLWQAEPVAASSRAFPRLLGAGRARAREVAIPSRSVVGQNPSTCRIAEPPSLSRPRRRHRAPSAAAVAVPDPTRLVTSVHMRRMIMYCQMKKSDLIARCLARPAVAYRSLPRRWTLELRQKQELCEKFQTCSLLHSQYPRV